MRVGPYEVTGEIARGAMGAVVRARTEQGEPVAIKLLLLQRDGAKNARMLKRFQREATALMRLRHPNVVGIRDGGEHEGQHYLVVDLVDGQNLQERINLGGALDEDDAAGIAYKLALGLQAAHDASVLHRDLKPANVLLDATGEPRLTDFGLAMIEDLSGTGASRPTQQGTFLGTPGYWPPEQARGALDEIGPHSDVYGLGATLYAMLTGYPPFEAGHALGIACIHEDPEPPSARRRGVDRALEAICMRCLQRAPGDRYVSAAALAQDLERFLAGQLEAPGSRRPVWLAAGAALLLVCGGLAAALRPAARTDDVSQRDPPAPVASEVPAPPPVVVEPPPVVVEPPQVEETKTAKQWYDEGHAHYEARNWKAALGPFNRSLELEPDNPTALTQRGLTLAKLRRNDEALADYDSALRIAPNHALALANRGHVHVRQGNWQRALPDLERAVQLDPKMAATWNNVGIARSMQGDSAGALRAFGRCIRLEPGNVDAFNNRARINWQRGALREAASDYGRVFELDPSDPGPLAQRGMVRVQLGDMGGVADVERSLAIDANCTAGLHNLGAIRRRQGNLPEAIRLFTRCLEIDPNRPETIGNLARAKLESKDFEGALADMTRLIQVSPTAQSWLNRSVVKDQMGDSAGAIEDCTQAIKVDPNWVNPWINRGTSHKKLGDTAKAIADYRQALKLGAPAAQRAQLEAYIRENGG